MKLLELIIVDDGSEDNTTDIIKEYAKVDKRIKMIKNRINMGSLYSRLVAANYSKGEYGIFFDADDMLTNPNVLDYLLNLAYKYKVDMIQYNYYAGNHTRYIEHGTFIRNHLELGKSNPSI